MRALTLTQPWATLVAIGAKRIETRAWYTAYRGPLAIHAAKGWSRDDTLRCFEEPFTAALLAAGIVTPGDLPLGAIVATVRLIHIVRTDIAVATISPHERAFGDYAPGRFAWQFVNAVALPTPIPARGSLGVWEWDETMLEGTP